MHEIINKYTYHNNNNKYILLCNWFLFTTTWVVWYESRDSDNIVCKVYQVVNQSIKSFRFMNGVVTIHVGHESSLCMLHKSWSLIQDTSDIPWLPDTLKFTTDLDKITHIELICCSKCSAFPIVCCFWLGVYTHQLIDCCEKMY